MSAGGHDEPSEVVDALGLLCPLPIVRTRQAVARAPAGGLVVLWADDAEILKDLPAWCAGTGHVLVSLQAGEAPGGRRAWCGVVRKT